MYKIFCLSMVVLTLSVLGCESSQNELPTLSISASDADKNSPTPSEVTAQFLQALKQGNNDLLCECMTEKARVLTGNKLFPQTESPLAKYSIENSYEGKDGLNYVKSSWTDNNQYGQSQTEHVTWILKKEYSEWKIVGMVADNVTPGSKNKFIDFEKPQSIPAHQPPQSPESNEDSMTKGQTYITQDPFQTPRR